MRYAVLSDVHANLIALEATVAAARRQGVDAWLCAGDLVGYGPHPNECIEVVAALGATCVVGNHDLMALGELSLEDQSPLVRVTQEWTRRALGPEARSYLGSLPRVVTLPGIAIAHGSLDDPTVYVTGDAAASAELRELAASRPELRTLILGHTHRWLAYVEGTGRLRIPRSREVALPVGTRHLLNPASVGQSRQIERVPRARFLVLDTERARASFYLVPFDVAAARDALRRRGLPAKGLHRPRPPVRGAVRRARRAGSRVVANRRRAPGRADGTPGSTS